MEDSSQLGSQPDPAMFIKSEFNNQILQRRETALSSKDCPRGSMPIMHD
ncbi:hypothetical protein GCM10008933_46740 [Paenibacillus motobuensis]|uniref:Uncharacterized protein n=1 Tax=Paenibacillus motobuensis TaxID=295324 RepID=A0ABP3IMT7_9BACL